MTMRRLIARWQAWRSRRRVASYLGGLRAINTIGAVLADKPHLRVELDKHLRPLQDDLLQWAAEEGAAREALAITAEKETT